MNAHLQLTNLFHYMENSLPGIVFDVIQLIHHHDLYLLRLDDNLLLIFFSFSFDFYYLANDHHHFQLIY